MRHALRTCLFALATTLLAACSDDPVAPPGGATPHDGYDGSIELFGGRISSIFGVNNQVCVAGDLLARFDGDTWRPLAAFPSRFWVYPVWSTVNNQVYAYERGWSHDTLYRLRNGAWDTIGIPFFAESVCPFRDGRFIAPGHYGDAKTAVLRFDGLRFDVDSLSVTEWLTVSGDRYDNAFATSNYGFIAHFNGTSWTDMSVDSTFRVHGAWQFGNGPLYALLDQQGSFETHLYELDGSQLTMCSPPGADFLPLGLHPGQDGTCFVIGIAASSPPEWLVYRLEGSTWTEVMSAPERLFDLWVSGDGNIYATSDQGVWRHDGKGTRRILESTPSIRNFNELWVSPEGTVFAAGSSVFRNDGGTWQDTHLNDLTDQEVYGIGGRSDSDFFVVGYHMIAHFYDNHWDWEATGFDSSVNDIWVGDGYTLAATSKGLLQRVNDEWRQMPGTNGGLLSVGGAAGVVYAVGGGGLILRLDRDGQWVREESPTSTALVSVVALDDGSAIAVGDDAHFFLVRDIRGWRKVTTSHDLRAVCAAPSNGAYLIGDDGVLHFDGRNVTRIIDNISTGISVAATANGDILACDRTTLIRYRRR